MAGVPTLHEVLSLSLPWPVLGQCLLLPCSPRVLASGWAVWRRWRAGLSSPRAGVLRAPCRSCRRLLVDPASRQSSLPSTSPEPILGALTLHCESSRLCRRSSAIFTCKHKTQLEINCELVRMSFDLSSEACCVPAFSKRMGPKSRTNIAFIPFVWRALDNHSVWRDYTRFWCNRFWRDCKSLMHITGFNRIKGFTIFSVFSVFLIFLSSVLCLYCGCVARVTPSAGIIKNNLHCTFLHSYLQCSFRKDNFDKQMWDKKWCTFLFTTAKFRKRIWNRSESSQLWLGHDHARSEITQQSACALCWQTSSMQIDKQDSTVNEPKWLMFPGQAKPAMHTFFLNRYVTCLHCNPLTAVLTHRLPFTFTCLWKRLYSVS